MKKLLIILICILSIQSVNAQKNKNPEKIKPVLIVMDIQNAYLSSMDQSESDLMFEYINYYIELFRKYDFPVITVYHQTKEGFPNQDSVAFHYPESVNILPEDAKIIKNYPSAFTTTDLHKTIQEEGGNTLFICGISATGCVLATYLAAYEYDYETFLLKGALSSHNAKYTDYIEEVFGALNPDIVRVVLESAQ